jgi:hypothetical protein
MKDVKRFGLKGKLVTRYIGPFPTVEKYGPMAYKLDIPPSLDGVHNMFHVAHLTKCFKAPSVVILPDVMPLKANLSYPEHLNKLLDQKDHATRRKILRF